MVQLCSYVRTDLLFNSLLTGCGNKSVYHYIFYDKQGSILKHTPVYYNYPGYASYVNSLAYRSQASYFQHLKITVC